MLVSENRAFALSSNNIDQYIESFSKNSKSGLKGTQGRLNF